MKRGGPRFWTLRNDDDDDDNDNGNKKQELLKIYPILNLTTQFYVLGITFIISIFTVT